MSLSKYTSPTKEQAASQVFSNWMLVEHIVERAIRSNQGFGENRNTEVVFSNKDTLNLRLVNRVWMDTIAKFYREAKQPLYHLRLTHENISGPIALGDVDEEDENNVDQTILSQFLASMTQWGYSKANENFPDFHLQLCPSFFRVASQEVYDMVFDFLQEYGTENMVRFTFNFHRHRFNYIPTSDTFPEFHFPNLKHIELVIERMAWSFIPLIQKMLEASPNLDVLNFTSSSCIITYSMAHLNATIDAIARSRPYNLMVPANVRKIWLHGTIDSCSCFYKLSVENVKKLETVSISASECMMKQFEHLIIPTTADTLLHLNFVGYTSCVFHFNRHYEVKFEPMPNLQSLTISMPWEVKRETRFEYESHLPALKELNVIHHDAGMFAALFTARSSKTVEKCTVICVQPLIYADNGYRGSSQRLDVTRKPVLYAINKGLPNLVHLGLVVSGRHTSGLEYVLKRMPRLKSLAIYVETSLKYKTHVHWDSLFTGFSTKACKSFSERRDLAGYGEKIKLIDKKYPSLRKLKELEALYIIETTYPNCRAFTIGMDMEGNGGAAHGGCDYDCETLPTAPGHLFSNMSFYFAFLRMEKLKKLAFTRGFMPSENMQRQWLKEKEMKIRIIRAPMLYHLFTARFSLDDDAWYHES